MTFCIKVDEIIGKEEGRGSDAGFDEAGVKGRAFPEVSVLSIIQEFAPKRAEFRRQQRTIIHMLISFPLMPNALLGSWHLYEVKYENISFFLFSFIYIYYVVYYSYFYF